MLSNCLQELNKHLPLLWTHTLVLCDSSGRAGRELSLARRGLEGLRGGGRCFAQQMGDTNSSHKEPIMRNEASLNQPSSEGQLLAERKLLIFLDYFLPQITTLILSVRRQGGRDGKG